MLKVGGGVWFRMAEDESDSASADVVESSESLGSTATSKHTIKLSGFPRLAGGCIDNQLAIVVALRAPSNDALQLIEELPPNRAA